MNLVATGPVVPPLASGPWQGVQNVLKFWRPDAIEASVGLIGLGSRAASSRCSLGMIATAPRGITPAGIAKFFSPGMMRAVWVMLLTQRKATTPPRKAPAPATSRRV